MHIDEVLEFVKNELEAKEIVQQAHDKLLDKNKALETQNAYLWSELNRLELDILNLKRDIQDMVKDQQDFTKVSNIVKMDRENAILKSDLAIVQRQLKIYQEQLRKARGFVPSFIEETQPDSHQVDKSHHIEEPTSKNIEKINQKWSFKLPTDICSFAFKPEEYQPSGTCSFSHNDIAEKQSTHIDNTPQGSSQISENPQIVDESPQIVDESPQIVDESPQVVDKSPQIVDESPQVVDESPKVIDESPQIVDESPRISENLQVVGESPQIVDESPQISENPQIVDGSQKIKENPQDVPDCADIELFESTNDINDEIEVYEKKIKNTSYYISCGDDMTIYEINKGDFSIGKDLGRLVKQKNGKLKVEWNDKS